jgi:hypothetical protein
MALGGDIGIASGAARLLDPNPARRVVAVVRSTRARGGCPAHGGRVRPAACSFSISLRSAWSLHHSNTPELNPE